MRHKVNCFNSNLWLDREDWENSFQIKYKRKPKIWDIESLHNLWLKSKERSDKRSKDVWDQITKIAESIPANDRGEHHAYYTQDGETRCYIVRYESTYKSHSLGNETMKFKTREEKLDFFLSTELNFQMGEELKRLKEFESKYHWVTFNILWDQVEEKLRKKFKNSRPDSSFTIEIGDKKYIISTEDRYGSYHKFKLESELTEPIRIN